VQIASILAKTATRDLVSLVAVVLSKECCTRLVAPGIVIPFFGRGLYVSFEHTDRLLSGITETFVVTLGGQPSNVFVYRHRSIHCAPTRDSRSFSAP
jgi:hypothetical protein